MKRLVLFLLLLLVPALVQAGDFYTHGSFPAPGSQATSAGMRAELDLIQAGFDKLPALTGNANKIVMVNGSGTGLTTAAGTITIPVSLTISGSYGLTWNLSNTTSLTLPTSGTLSTIAGSETLSNKILSAPTFSGTATGPLTLTGNVNTDGTFEFTNASSNSAIGASRNSAAKLYLGGTWAPSAGQHGEALAVRTALTAELNQDSYGALIYPSIATAASGTHLNIEGLEVVAPTIVSNGATVTNASTLHLVGAPSTGTNRYNLWAQGGTHRLEPHVLIGTGFADTPNNLVQIGGTWAPSSATWISGLAVRPTVTGVANQDLYTLAVLGDFVKAGSGTHANVSTAWFEPVGISGSGSTITNAMTLGINGAPSAGTNNYAVYVMSGASRLGGSLILDRGISRAGSSVQSKNLTGTCTFVASTTCNVSFGTAEDDANYYVVLGCDTQCGRWGSRTVNGFTITTSTSNSGTCHWMIIR